MKRAAMLAAILNVCLISVNGQDSIQWMTFEEMETAFAQQPKKVFIDFWAEWCAACHRMDRNAFQVPEVVEVLNENYYPVKMNAESVDTITFGGKAFVNQSATSRKRYYHELAVLLGSGEDGQFTLPAMVIYDEQFQRIARYDAYMSSKNLMRALAHISD